MITSTYFYIRTPNSRSVPDQLMLQAALDALMPGHITWSCHKPLPNDMEALTIARFDVDYEAAPGPGGYRPDRFEKALRAMFNPEFLSYERVER